MSVSLVPVSVLVESRVEVEVVIGHLRVPCPFYRHYLEIPALVIVPLFALASLPPPVLLALALAPVPAALPFVPAPARARARAQSQSPATTTRDACCLNMTREKTAVSKRS